MIFLDAMIVNVAIPDIQREFGAGETGIQWVVAAYSLTMAMFMMSGGTWRAARVTRHSTGWDASRSAPACSSWAALGAVSSRRGTHQGSRARIRLTRTWSRPGCHVRSLWDTAGCRSGRGPRNLNGPGDVGA
jgi:MFS family permease